MKRPAWIAPLAAIVGFLAATTCCLPVGVFLAAAGLAGVAPLLGPARPYLLGLSIAMLALGFWQVHGRTACPARGRLGSVILLWTAAGMVVVLFLFPQFIAGLLADLFAIGSSP
jgi:hypothetical protein